MKVNTLGAIEAGGTKFICGVGTGPDDLRTFRVPTTAPQETIAAAVEILKNEGGAGLAAVGIGSFGPVKAGRIGNTPKQGWQNVDLAGEVGRALGVPIGFDSDVNAAALSEAEWGAARGLASCLYLTVGTGIGGGALFAGKLLGTPEMGHIRIPTDSFPGVCPFHGNCLEGVASGPAMAKRWGKPAGDLPPDHPAWAIEARCLALACANFFFTLGPEQIILGGGVMSQLQLFPLIRREFAQLVNQYLELPDEYIVPPALGDRAGVLGALLLARRTVR